MGNSIDVHVGRRIRQRRWMLGITQTQLADAVGIRFQQIQKYETGANRISASRMHDIGTLLDVPVAYFFEGLDGQTESPGDPCDNVWIDKEAADLVRAYYAIPENQRRSLYAMACEMTGAA